MTTDAGKKLALEVLNLFICISTFESTFVFGLDDEELTFFTKVFLAELSQRSNLKTKTYSFKQNSVLVHLVSMTLITDDSNYL